MVWTERNPGDPIGTTNSNFANDLTLLRQRFAGTEPSSGNRIAHQVWSDTSTDHVVKELDEGATKWRHTEQYLDNVKTDSGISATETWFLTSPFEKSYLKELRLLSDTATASSDGSNNYTINVTNVTDTLELFSTDPTTNGAEIAVDTVYKMTPDQNNRVTEDKVLEVTITKNGSPTDLSSARVKLVAVWICATDGGSITAT